MKLASTPAIEAAAVLFMLGFAIARTAPALAHDMGEMGDMDMGHDSAGMSGMSPGDMDAMSMSAGHNDHDPHLASMKNMSLHMDWTAERPLTDADRKRAAGLVTTLQSALDKYKDYHAAEADGFKPFHPEFKQQKIVHFTRTWYAVKASFTFNAAEPTSLLYERTPDGGYKLVGAMYTDRKNATVDQLNERVPLSVARWHRHINLCFPARGADMQKADWTVYGTNGSIATKEACEAVHGRWVPQLFGWMVHVYPWESDPKLVWAH